MSLPTPSATPAGAVPEPFKFDPVADAVAAIKNGEFVVVMDDEDRENEGDIICAASKVTAEGMSWFIKWTSGYICMSMLPSRLEELRLPPLLSSAGRNEDVKGTAYHLTLDANSKSHPVGTGISASDRSMCARLVANGAGADDFTRPGHVVPLRYTVGGTRERVGHTEAAVDLCYLAGEPPVGLLCELVDPDSVKGDMARRDACWRFARNWNLKCISIADLREYLSGPEGKLVPTA